MGTRMSCFLLPLALVACRPAESAEPVSNSDARARLAVPSEGYQAAEVQHLLGVFRRQVFIKDGNVECVEWAGQPCVQFYGRIDADMTAEGTLQTGEVVKLKLLD